MDQDIRSLERRASAGDPNAPALLALAKIRIGETPTLAEAYAALSACPESIVVRGAQREVSRYPVVDGCLEQMRWSDLRDAKNWIATVVATPRGVNGLDRKFWARAGQRGWCILPTSLRPGDYLEVGADDKDGNDRSFFRVLARGDDELILRGSARPPLRPPPIGDELHRMLSPDDAAERALALARSVVERLRKELVEAEAALKQLESTTQGGSA